MRLAILGSTKGTDAEYILQSIRDGVLQGMSVECIISNREKAPILKLAEQYGVPGICITGKYANGISATRKVYDYKLHITLKKHRVNFVLLIGWMRILSSEFVEKWKNKILNIHPSLLPAYEGQMDMNIHRAVVERGCKITGATLMFIDDGADTGPIIDQTAININPSDSPENVKEKVQKAEKDLFMNYLPLLRDGKLFVQNNKAVVLE